MNIDRFTQEGQILESSNIESSNIEPNDLDPIYGHDMHVQTNKENIVAPVISQETIDAISTQIGEKVIQSVTSYLSRQKVSSNNVTSDSDNTMLWYLKELHKDAVYDDRTSGKKYFSNHLTIAKQDKIISTIENLNNQVDNLTTLVEGQSTTIAEQATIIKKQHEAIARFESDVVYKTQKDLIMELIGIADQLKMTLNDYSQNPEIDLHDAIEQLEEWVNGSLQAVAVRRYVNVESNELDRKRQEIIEIQETSKPEEDGKLKSLLPGYVWSVPMVGSNEMLQVEDRPKKFEFMIRPEQVARLQYVKADNDAFNVTSDIADNSEVKSTVEPDDITPNSMDVKNNEINESSDQEKTNKSKKDSWFKWS